MDKNPTDEPVTPDSTEFSISKEDSETSLSKATLDKIQCELDSNRLALSHRKWIIVILVVFSIILYVLFIWAVLFVLLCKEFTPYTMIPICLVGIIPTAYCGWLIKTKINEAINYFRDEASGYL